MSTNLIDLSNEETNLLDCGSSPNKDQLKPLPSNQNTTIDNYLFNSTNNFINSRARDSLDNNPFDKIQKQIDLLNDPFESVELSATNSKLHNKKEHEVRTENLLSLHEDEILPLTPEPSTIKENNFSSLSELSKDSPNFQSTPINLNISLTPQKPSSMKNKLKNNLLKLSISNASRRDSKTSDEDSPLTVLKLKDDINFSNNLSSSREDSCENLMNIKPNWIDSEADCESDIEMMKIPMLDKIDDKVFCSPTHSDSEQMLFRSRFNSEGSTSHFKAIREKIVNRKSIEKCENKSADELNDIINEFKNIILERKVKPSSVIESLKNALANEEKIKVNQTNIQVNPPAIIRQGTFDTELQDSSHLPAIVRQGTFDTELNDSSHLPDADKHICVNETNINKKDMEFVFQTPSSNQNFNNVFEQLGKFFEGTSNLNIVQSNPTSLNSHTTTPTYIVLMNNSQIVDKNFENVNEPAVRRRSQSLSASTKRPLINKPQLKPKVSPPKIIPPKLIRRNSVASTNNSQPRKSISNLNCKSLIMNNSQVTSSVQQKYTVSNAKSQMATDLQAKKLKFKSNENIAARGPLKATIPIKNLAKAIANTPAKDRLHSDKLNICTPVTRSSLPKASSTPLVTTSEISLLRRNRSSFLSSPKSTINLTSRRRTLTAAGPTTELLSRPTGFTKSNLPEKTIKNTLHKFKPISKLSLVKNKENNPTGH